MPSTVPVATEIIFFRFIYGYLTLIVMQLKLGLVRLNQQWGRADNCISLDMSRSTTPAG
jgi:hypothetical protein